MKLHASILASLLTAGVLLAAAPTANASHDGPIACVGDPGPELPGVCYDPEDGDDCDVYAGTTHGNQVCLVPAVRYCSSQAPEWPGFCYAPREECKLWFGFGRIYCIVPPDLGATTNSDPWPTCPVVLDSVRLEACADPKDDRCTVRVEVELGSRCVGTTIPVAAADPWPLCATVLDNPYVAACTDPKDDRCTVGLHVHRTVRCVGPTQPVAA